MDGSTTGRGDRTTLSLETLDADAESTFYESASNNMLESAELVETGAEKRVILGNVAGASDVDVFDLGPVVPGDRVVVRMTTDDLLDGAIALFDDIGSALLVNDHRNVYLGETQPFVDVVIRRPAQACYVAASATPGYDAFGAYGLVASKRPAQHLPEPAPDVILLVFEGASNVRIGSRPPVDVPPFDPAGIDPDYAGQAAEMIATIVAAVREDFATFDVTVLSTSEGDKYDVSMTRVFFGTYDAALLGVAEGIDEFNATHSQEAIVFTDTFSAFSVLNPSVEEIGAAIGNVASHEAGHLLGLVHTFDSLGIMDVTASLSELLGDQDFRRSPLYSEVFPIGYQDGIQTLIDTVGGSGLELRQKQIMKDLAPVRFRAQPSGPPARSQYYLSSCGLDS